MSSNFTKFYSFWLRSFLLLNLFFNEIGFGQQTVIWRSEPINPSGIWLFGSTCEPAGDGQWFYQSWGGFRQAPDCFGSTNDILFDNNSKLTMSLNVRDYGVKSIEFHSNNNLERTINSEGANRLFLNPNNGNPRITNNSISIHNFNTPITLGATVSVQLNAGNLTFNAINLNNHFIDLVGNIGRESFFNGVISGTGGIAVKNPG
jgi:hypothetical protein